MISDLGQAGTSQRMHERTENALLTSEWEPRLGSLLGTLSGYRRMWRSRQIVSLGVIFRRRREIEIDDSRG